MVRKTLAHYEILEKIGEGGMGEVYRARDPRLGREIAIKVLDDTSAEKRGRLRRFEKEARAASSLNHPNIITIYDVGEERGRAFIAMELIRGRTLREMLKDGPLPESELVAIASQIGRGLARAHRSGILHLDLKPDNVMVTDDGLVKILDFGLALLQPTADAGADALTVTREDLRGALGGTLPYMSPEQALGRPIDSRSDLFSFGVLLYEMATGQRPFRGETAGALFDEILNRTPASPSTLNPKSSPKLDAILARCLEKSAERRYDSAERIMEDLAARDVAPRSRAPDRMSIAVVPFKNLSPEKDAEYFADGLTEDVILDLSKVSRLRVISRASAMRLKDTGKDLRTVGEELNVQFVLEGSVRKSEERVRITAQLVDVRTDAHVWGDRFQGATDDVFAIQEEIARKIVDALQLTLSPDEDHRLRERRIDDVRARECYLRARQELWRFTEEALERARRLIQSGLDIVGDNELLFAAMGMVHWQFVNSGIRPTLENIETAAAYCEKALAAGGRAPQTYLLSGFLALEQPDLQQAIRKLQQALRVDPNDPDALFWLVVLLQFCGHAAKAEPLIERLLAIDPLSPQHRSLSGLGKLFTDGDAAEAIVGYRQWHEGDPENPIAHWMYGSALARSGQRDAAGRVWADLQRNPRAGSFARLAAMFERAFAGDREGTHAALTPDLVEAARADLQFSWEVGSGYALVGEEDRALEWLRHAVARGFLAYRFLGQHDPLLASLRDDERFVALMKHAKDRHERLEV